MTHVAVSPLFPGVRFAHAVSLGGNCEAAHGLRVCGRHSVRGLFDWLVTPLDAIAAVLSDEGARLGTDFEIVHDGTSIRCGAYDVLYHHEFPRDADNRVVHSAEAAANCRSKLIHKMATFLALRERGPILFVRAGIRTDLRWDRLGDQGVAPTAHDLDELAAALARTFPDLDFRLLVALTGPETPADLEMLRDPRIALVALPRQENGAWTIADATWRMLLARVEFDYATTAGNLGIDEPLYWFGEATSNDVTASVPPAAPAETTVSKQKAALKDAVRRGEAATAIDMLSTLVDASREPPDYAWRIGLERWRPGQSAHAVDAFAIAFRHGLRDLVFMEDYLGLLTGETRYAEVLRILERMRKQNDACDNGVSRQVLMLSGHAKLALARPRDAAIALARAREISAAWLDTTTLLQKITAAVRERQPFAFIRVGDGEARYLIAATHGEHDPITAEEAHAMGDVCWENWFGEPLAAAGDASRTTLLAAYERAMRAVDVVGACSADRLRTDTGHYGYLAWQEEWLRTIFAGHAAPFWTDAHAHRHLNEQTPFLASLLEGQDVLGVISPHPGLAEALRQRLRIGTVVSHVVPAEGRLPTAPETRALGQHFPTIFEELLATLSVPRPGCVFLIAAGLLGKIYSARIKELGGIALDIGALADAWMGYDTRDGQQADVARLEISPTTTSLSATSNSITTYGCVSLFRTGSHAFVEAIRNAGIPAPVRLHFLGPRIIEVKRTDPDQMLDLAIRVAGRIEDATHHFRLVTSVRDPIARILSQAFSEAEARGVDVGDRASIISWWDTQPMGRFDLWPFWFDDTFLATFGFDFREHPFDHERKSVRFASDKLRLLVLRQEDDRSRREAELEWLLDRGGVQLNTVNDAARRKYGAAYRAFVEDFVAPSSWLDTYYDAEVVRHYYTEAERDAFRAHWSGPRPSPVRLPDAPSRKHACLSMMKTSSTALAAALSDAGFADVPHLHHLGPETRGQKTVAGVRADAFEKHLEDPTNRFAIVTCIRDPIARWISQAFHSEIEFLARTRRSIVESAESFIEWVDSRAMPDLSSDWFDNSLKASFGFDYKVHPFDFERKSLRFASDRLRLLIIRQEDHIAVREAELGWLVERDRVAIPVSNDSAVRFADRYRAFRDHFVAPDAWIDTVYETEVVRHFYTESERDAFRARWRPGTFRKTRTVSTPASVAEAQPANAIAAPQAQPATPAPQAKTCEASTELETLKGRIRDGYVLELNDYAYRPRERDWSASRGAAKLRTRFDGAEPDYAALLERFCGFDHRFRAIPVLAQDDTPFWENWWLPGLDAVALYGLVATLKPRLYLEIGSGHSTRFVRQSIIDNGLATRIVSIDPNPTSLIDALCDEVVRSRCEDTPLSAFAELQAGDMLFFDGGHRSFQNSDTTVFFTEILPTLAPGVVYGLHDIFLPYDYPESWLTRFYNEQYLLMAYLLGGAGGDEVLFPAHHVSREPAFAPLRNRLFLGTRHLDWLVSSFWMRRAGG